MNPVFRQEDGSLLLSLPHAEGLVLCSMPQRIEALLSSEGFNRRVVERLFPIAYEDSSREAEYRKLLGDDLRRSKRESMETFKRTLENLEISQTSFMKITTHCNNRSHWGFHDFVDQLDEELNEAF